MAKQKPKRYYTRTIDLLFLLVFLIVGIVSFTSSDQVNVPYWVLPPLKRLSDTFSPQVIALAVGQLISGAAALLMTKVFFAVPI